MDTKLKKSKYNPFLKATAIILTVVFAFLTGTQSLNAIRKAVFYNCTDGDFSQTEAVQSSMRNVLWDLQALKPFIKFYSEDLTFENFCETDFAKEQVAHLYQEEERAIQLFRTIQELKKLKPEQMQKYKSELETKFKEIKDKIFAIDNDQKYNYQDKYEKLNEILETMKKELTEFEKAYENNDEIIKKYKA